MNKKAALACVLFSVIPIESSLADTELRTFRSGDTIRSSEINRNFSNLDEKDEALEDKIDGNYNTLDNRVSTLESGSSTSAGSSSSSITIPPEGFIGPYAAVENFQYEYSDLEIGSIITVLERNYVIVAVDVMSHLNREMIQVKYPAPIGANGVVYYSLTASDAYYWFASDDELTIGGRPARLSGSTYYAVSAMDYGEEFAAQQSASGYYQSGFYSRMSTNVSAGVSIRLDAGTLFGVSFGYSEGCRASGSPDDIANCARFDVGQRDLRGTYDASKIPTRDQRNALLGELLQLVNYVTVLN